MTGLKKESNFFHYIAPKIMEIVDRGIKNNVIVHNKGLVTDYATQIDIDTEKLLTEKIKSNFPEDKILAEELSPETQQVEVGRIWIIDPICGTTNLTRDFGIFVTNIALAEDGELIASCVVDHSKKEYCWSVGDNQLYLGKTLVVPKKQTKENIVDVDLPAISSSKDRGITQRYMKFVEKMLLDEELYVVATGSSRSHEYVALGRADAFISPYNKVWDCAAANFLVQQSGGVISQLDGQPWKVLSKNVIAANDINLHSKIVSLYNQ